MCFLLSVSLPSSLTLPKPTLKSSHVTSFRVLATHKTSKDSALVNKPSKAHMLSTKNLKAYHAKLQEVHNLFHDTVTKSPLECLIMIDTLQRLAIDYHFQEEIQSTLTSYYTDLMNGGGAISSNGDNSLIYISLCFRILRQNGYNLTADVFNTFMDKGGRFREWINRDLRGMVGLYEASQFGVGEKVLDHANAVSSKYLRDSLPHLNPDESHRVNQTLNRHYDITLSRFNVKYHLKYDENNHILLQDLAKMDFNILQSLHQSELQEVCKWWRDMGLSQHLNFARDQPVKWFTWPMACLPEPMFSEQRVYLTKLVALVYLMDDIFDVYGTLDQLVLFSEAINKWEVDGNDQLPYPMKLFLKALFNTTNEISYQILIKHGWNPIKSLKKAWISLSNAFLVEAKWFAAGHSPTTEEYLKNGVISTGVHVLFVHAFFLLGEGIGKESVDHLDNIPGLISYPAMILRLWDDMGSAEDENQQGYDGSYIECYMNEHKSSTADTARRHAMKMISSSWRNLKKEFLLPGPFSLTFKKASLNTARMVRFMYSYDKDQRQPVLENHIKSLLYKSIPMNNNVD